METNNEKITVSKNIHENINNLRQILGIGKSFDVIQLDLLYAERDMAVFFIDGFIKDDVFVQIMKLLSGLKAEEISDHPLEKLLRSYIPYVEIDNR